MDQKQLKQQLTTHGYTIRFSKKNMTFSNDVSKCTIKQEAFNGKRMWIFDLTGPKPSDDVMDEVVAYLEQLEQEQNAVLLFQTSGFHYVHPRYYTFGSIHSVESPYEGNLFFLFHALYHTCIEEEKRDPLFEWTFEPSHENISLKIVKTNALNHLVFSHRDAGFFIKIRTNDSEQIEHVASVEKCLAFWQTFVEQTDRKHRLLSLYETPSYYTTRFLNTIKLNGEATETVFQHLCETHDAEEVERYFKRLTENQVTILKNKTVRTCFLVQLMDSWIVKSWKPGRKVFLFPYDQFDEALTLYKELVFEASIFTYTDVAIQKIQTRVRKDDAQ